MHGAYRHGLGALALTALSACASLLGVDDAGYVDAGAPAGDATDPAGGGDEASSDAAGPHSPPDAATPDGAAVDGSRVDATRDATADAPPVARALVFVTSRLVPGGELRGHQQADELCTTLAQSAGLHGQFVAWISDSNSDAIDRLGNAKGPWFSSDPTRDAMVYANAIELTTVPPQTSIKNTEDGAVQSDVLVWTGTTNAGRLKVSANAACGDWLDASLGGRCGENIDTTAWTDIVDEDCVVPHGIYCFQR